MLKDPHNTTSAAENKAVQRRQQLCLAFQLSAYMNSKSIQCWHQGCRLMSLWHHETHSAIITTMHSYTKAQQKGVHFFDECPSLVRHKWCSVVVYFCLHSCWVCTPEAEQGQSQDDHYVWYPASVCTQRLAAATCLACTW